MRVLVDTSLWVDYFRGGYSLDRMDWLIDEGIKVPTPPTVTPALPSSSQRTFAEK